MDVIYQVLIKVAVKKKIIIKFLCILIKMRKKNKKTLEVSGIDAKFQSFSS